MMRASVFRLSPFLLLATALVAVTVFFAPGAQPAQAQQTSITVNAGCTLAQAINEANGATSGVGNCAAGTDGGHDIIELTADVTLDAHLPEITSDITINGNDYTIDGADLYRPFETGTTHVRLTLNDLTVTRAKSPAGSGGGAIHAREAQGFLVLNRVTISDSEAVHYGGAIACLSSVLHIRDSVFNGNRGNGGGGAITSHTCKTVIERSAFYNNTNIVGGNFGGGAIFHNGVTAIAITNSTFYNNNGGGEGSAILLRTSATSAVNRLSHLTITGNKNGPALHIDDARTVVHLRNSIVHVNPGTSCKRHTSRALAVNENNIIGAAGDGTGNKCGTGVNGSTDQPLLASSATGDIPYFTLAENSPAVDAAGDCRSLTTHDQRGADRPQGAACDIGAYESPHSFFSLSTGVGGNQVTEGQTLTITGTLNAAVSDHTPYTAFGVSQGPHDVRVDLDSYVHTTGTGLQKKTDTHIGKIRVNRDTFRVRIHAVDDEIAEVSPEPVTVFVRVDRDLDGAYELERSIDIAIVDNDVNAIVMTSSSTTLREGGHWVSVTLALQDESAIPEVDLPAGRRGLRVRVTPTGTASPGPHADWDYDMRPSQVEWFLDDDGQRRGRRFSYVEFTPTNRRHTLNLLARGNDGAEPTETIILTAEDINNPGLRGTLTLTIPGTCTNCGTLGEPGVVTFASADHADLIEDIYEWRNDPRYVGDKRHTDRWDRVLLAFGETVSDTSLTAMTASEAQSYADRGWSRWVGVAEALRDLESSGQPQDPEPDIPNRAPVASAVGDVTIVNESGTRSFTSNSMFEDPDKDDMTVGGTSSDTSVATVSASSNGSILTVSAKSRGTATITATADDGNGDTAINSFTVRVKAAPTVARTLSDISGLTAGTSQLVSLSGVFSDADGDALSITAGATDEGVAVAEMSSDGASLTVTGVSAGETGIGVFAHDSDGNQTTANFTVTVTASEPVVLVPPQDEGEQPQQQPEQSQPDPSPTPEPEVPAQEPETETPGPEATDDVVSMYDTNGDGKIDRAEMGNAINDYIAGKITYPQLVEVNKAFQSS